MNKEKRAALDKAVEAMNSRLLKAIGEMSHVNWVVVKKELDMTREQIMAELAFVFILWAEGERNPEALQGLLETPERELMERLGINYDDYVEKALEEAKAQETTEAA